MTNDSANLIRLFFFLMFIGTLVAGVYLLRNFEKLFGPSPDMAGENSSERAYSKMQVFVIWAHAAALTGSFALFLD